MKNLFARGGIEFLAVLFGISGSLWVDDYRVGLINKEKSISTLNSLKDELIDDKEYFLNRHSMITDNNKILNLIIDNWGYNNSDSLINLKFERRNLMLRLRGYYAFHPPRTIYNSLSSDGSLALIPDYDLKRKINLVFNGRTKHLIEGAENNRHLYRRFNDYLIENHPKLLNPNLKGFNEEMDALLADQVIFAYLIEQQGLRSFLLRTIDNHLNEVNDLMNNIDLYLSK